SRAAQKLDVADPFGHPHGHDGPGPGGGRRGVTDMNVAGIERTRLVVEGVGTAITAEVTRRRSDRLVVAQAVPFLRLDTPVTAEGGKRARIARVAIAMEGDVPRLMLELAHDDAPPLEAPVTEAEAEREPTLPG